MSLYDLTKGKTRDDAGKLDDPTDFDNNIAAALQRYSKHRPRLACIDIFGNNSNDLALPSDWLEGFSGIESIEYPVGTVPETVLDADDWRLYRKPTGTVIRLVAAPKASESVRLLYTIVHDEDSVPGTDLEAVANLAASFCCRQLAAVYGNSSDPTIQADVVNYQSKTDQYRRLADSLEKLYKDHLGLKDNDTTPPAMATVAPADSSRTRLTHWS